MGVRAGARAARGALAAAVAAIAGSFALLSPAAALAGGPCVGCSGSYSGEWSMTYQRLEHHGFGAEEHATIRFNVKWAAALTFQGGENVWTLTSASGTFSISGSGSSNEDCSATLSPGPDSIVHGEAYWIATAPGKGLRFEDENEYDTIIAQPPSSWGQSLGANPLKSSTSAGGCGEQSTWGIENPNWGKALGGADCHLEAASGKDWIAFPKGGAHTAKDECVAPPGNDGLGDSWSGVSYTAEETLDVPGKAPPGGGGAVGAKGGPDYRIAKREALKDLREHAIPNAMRFCLPYAGGLLTFGSGVLLLGAGPAIGGSLAVTGSLTATALLPFCNATLTRLGKDLKAYRDPPLSSIDVLAWPHAGSAAALPSCAPYASQPALAGYCAQLSGAYARLDAAAQLLAADAGAIEQTVSRETAAVRAHNQAAANAQDSHLATLLPKLRGDRAAEQAAGNAVAAVLAADGVRFALSRSQAARAIAAALRQAARRGVPTRTIRALAPAALRPAATDLRLGLAHL